MSEGTGQLQNYSVDQAAGAVHCKALKSTDTSLKSAKQTIKTNRKSID